jgi:hypothetical protein
MSTWVTLIAQDRPDFGLAQRGLKQVSASAANFEHVLKHVDPPNGAHAFGVKLLLKAFEIFGHFLRMPFGRAVNTSDVFLVQ